MRVLVPIEFKPQGGGFYFLQMFENFLKDNGWEITRDIKGRFDVLFTNHWMTPYKDIVRAFRSNPRVRIVHRIDGAAQDYGRDPEADRRQSAVNRLADLTVFQSEYCRLSTREKFEVIHQDGPVIYNPVDSRIFSPIGSKKLVADCDVTCVSWSTNPLKGAAKIYRVAAANPDLHFVLCGNYSDAPQLANLHQQGVLDRENLAATLRSCKALLTFSLNEACPNHVLEALASGLPILYEDSGAMKEVVGPCGYPVTTDSFRSKFNLATANSRELSAKSRQRALDLFNPNVAFPQYLEAINSVIKRPTHVSLQRRWVIVWKNLLSCSAS